MNRNSKRNDRRETLRRRQIRAVKYGQLEMTTTYRKAA